MAKNVGNYTRGGGWAGMENLTRERWLSYILLGKQTFNVQPPDYWLRIQQREEGRDIKTASSIWYLRYKPERKMMIWDQAPDEDFVARGYLK